MSVFEGEHHIRVTAEPDIRSALSKTRLSDRVRGDLKAWAGFLTTLTLFSVF